MRIVVAWVVVIAIAAAAFIYGRDYIRRHPQDVPWTPLRLDDPVGYFMLRKIVALSGEPAECRALLRQAGSSDVAVPPHSDGPSCGYRDGMRLIPAGPEVRFAPAGVVTSCPVAAALYVFDRQVVQPAALEHLGSRVAAVEHAGTYSCRRLYGRAAGAYSEHASANAIDIIGFRLVDGRSISVRRHWHSEGAEGDFLHQVRDGACRLFSTTLSPDYNAAHADHVHLDQAGRGTMGFGVCR